MLVKTAEAMGMCFGVRDALAITRKLDNPTQVTVHGQLVHNPLVNAELENRGFTLASEAHRQLPATEQVLITAHGISDAERARLAAAGKTLIDTTCPLVKKAHAAARRLQSLGFHVLVIGQRHHVEIRGLTGDLVSFDILETLSDVKTFAHPKLGLVAQTTCPDRDAREIVAAVRRRNPNALVRFINTICQPTRDRQIALEHLLDQVDILVVVGGRNSNNTRRLVERAKERRVPAIHVEQAADLHEALFAPGLIVGLTAGTSTLPETIESVRQRLESIHPVTMESEPAHIETH